MMTHAEYQQLLKDGGCVHDERNRVCGAAVTPGKKHCPKHEAQLAAKEAMKAAKERR